MNQPHDDAAPEWAARFLAALREGYGPKAAAAAAGVASATPRSRRRTHEAFRAAWDACRPVAGARGARMGPVPRRNGLKLDRFLAELAETSNVSAAAALADISVGVIYKLRRSDPGFARRWYAALAEGYDNLEMELLGRLRSGEPDGGNAAKKFDTATALRCLTAHRESVAREKGRRTLAAEVTTIAAINARIDEMRLKQEVTQKAIGKVRKGKALPVAKAAKMIGAAKGGRSRG